MPRLTRFLSLDDLPTPSRKVTEPVVRFADKVTFSENGCWIWSAARYRNGYGKFAIGTRYYVAHRWAYAFFVGPMAEDMVLDHLCRTPACVNPDHLEEVTMLTNIRRSSHYMSEECSYGHARIPENLYYWGGSRYCRPCRNRVTRDRKREKRGTT